MRCAVKLFLILSVLVHSVVSAWSAPSMPTELTFGPEFTFGTIEYSSLLEGDLKKMQEALQSPHRPFRYKTVSAQDTGYDPLFHHYLYPVAKRHKWGLEFTFDPGVVEVHTTPMTTREVAANAKHLQRDIFDLVKKKTGREPMLFAGGGHINIGIQYFIGKDPVIFYNFITDFLNNNQLFLGIWNYDTNNALPLCLTQINFKRDVVALLQKWYRDHKGQPLNAQSTQKLSRLMYYQLSRYKDEFSWSENARYKHWALYLGNMEGPQNTARLELRGVRPQVDVQTYLHQIRLIEARLKYLEKLPGPLPYRERVALTHPLRPTTEHRLTPPVDPQQALRAFYLYVTEAGQNWQDHRHYIWPMWISGGELERFEKSEWFLDRQGGQVCAGALQ